MRKIPFSLGTPKVVDPQIGNKWQMKSHVTKYWPPRLARTRCTTREVGSSSHSELEWLSQSSRTPEQLSSHLCVHYKLAPVGKSQVLSVPRPMTSIKNVQTVLGLPGAFPKNKVMFLLLELQSRPRPLFCNHSFHFNPVALAHLTGPRANLSP